MQAYDQNNRLFETMFGTKEELLKKKADLLASQLAGRVEIGEMPVKGEQVTIKNLSYHVHSVIGSRVFLELDNPKKDIY